MRAVKLHRERPRPAMPVYEDDLDRLRRLACEGLYWQDEVEANHAMLLHCALDLLAVSWRSERLREEQSRLGSVGAQGERLARLTAEIKELGSAGAG
jgi:hypothetical protein